MDRVILHCDCNNFYASVECLFDPALRNLPVAVCGSVESRHGIVLAKNYLAKRCGVQTGDAVWMAKEKCPDIKIVPPSFDKYLYFSKQARAIYNDYTDQVESFGLDECWLDLTGSVHLFGDGETIAHTIRNRIKDELGITVSVGVSFNKIFAKLGSDYKKPDAVTVISRDDFKTIVWPMPVSDLLYVGSSTARTLNMFGINTIGALANADVKFLKSRLGKNGVTLWNFANGYDNTPVTKSNYLSAVKSVGNSTTTPRDLICDNDVKIVLYSLAESVASRLRDMNKYCNTVQLHVRDKELNHYSRQATMQAKSCNSNVIFDTAFELFKKNHPPQTPIRSLGISTTNLEDRHFEQLSFFGGADKSDQLDATVEALRDRFGRFSVQRGIMLSDTALSNVNPKDDHVIHPTSYFK